MNHSDALTMRAVLTASSAWAWAAALPARCLTSTMAINLPLRATISISPPGVLWRIERMRNPFTRSTHAASVSAERPARAAWRRGSGTRFDGERGIVNLLALEPEAGGDLFDG